MPKYTGDEVLFDGLVDPLQTTMVSQWLLTAPGAWRGGILRDLHATLLLAGSPPWDNATLLSSLFTVWANHNLDTPLVNLD